VSQNLILSLEQLWTEALAAPTLTTLVMVVLQGVRRLGVAVVADVLDERDSELRARELRCPKRGGTMRRDKSRREGEAHDLAREVTYRHTSFCCHGCGHREFPARGRGSPRCSDGSSRALGVVFANPPVSPARRRPNIAVEPAGRT
jgi:hypothetical protein